MGALVRGRPLAGAGRAARACSGGARSDAAAGGAGAVGRRRTRAARRAREALFAELVALERTARARGTSPRPPISASSSSRGWSRSTRISPRWTNAARHERARPSRGRQDLRGPARAARRERALRARPGRGGARPQRRGQDDAAGDPVDAGVAFERRGPLGRPAARARVAAAGAHRLRRPRPGAVRRSHRAREPALLLRAARLRRDARPRRPPAGAGRAWRRARGRDRADVLARHAAAARAGARARPRSGAAAVRRAVGGAGSGGRGLAAGRAGGRARRRPHRGAGDARSGGDRGDRRPGGDPAPRARRGRRDARPAVSRPNRCAASTGRRPVAEPADARSPASSARRCASPPRTCASNGAAARCSRP